jgi:hypothetical protein
MALGKKYWTVTVAIAGRTVESTKTPRPLTNEEIKLFAERVRESYSATVAGAEIEVTTTELE